MMKFALYDYLPRRYQEHAPFDQQDICRMILGFKDGRNVYGKWAARQFANAMSAMDLSDMTVVCVPASTHYAHVRRWKRFTQWLCQLTGAQNGFDHIQVFGSRKKAHVTGEYELATNIKHYVHIDDAYFRGRKVIVIDYIYTTGRSSSSFASALQTAGAKVVAAAFLAKTRRLRS